MAFFIRLPLAIPYLRVIEERILSCSRRFGQTEISEKDLCHVKDERVFDKTCTLISNKRTPDIT